MKIYTEYFIEMHVVVFYSMNGLDLPCVCGNRDAGCV